MRKCVHGTTASYIADCSQGQIFHFIGHTLSFLIYSLRYIKVNSKAFFHFKNELNYQSQTSLHLAKCRYVAFEVADAIGAGYRRIATILLCGPAAVQSI